jgi:CheY-like chemotaxis protein
MLIIRQQVLQLTRLVNDLLDAARISSGKLVVQRGTVRLADVIANATDMVAPLIAQHNIRFTVEHPAGDPYVECDPVRFAQMVGNLLHNACKFTPSGGQITLSAEVCGSELQVRVNDTGIGIEAGALVGIFELFSQSANGRHHREGGLGIGLSVVRELAAAHGGTVSVQSDGPYMGSTFTLALPIVVPRPTDAQENASLRPATTGIKVLVVDDNVDAADAMQMHLSQFGHDVSAAYSGPEALALLEEGAPQAVIVDLSMPVMDGFELARRIRERASWRSVVLIALSGYGQPDDIKRSREAGFEHHLIKPADPAALLSLLDSLKPSRPRGAFLHAVR